MVTDVNQATIAVCNAVEAAEQMANERITNVIVNVSGDRTRSVVRSSSISIHKNRPVGEEDVKKVTDKGLMKVNVEGNEPIHFLTMGYHVDNGEEVKTRLAFTATRSAWIFCSGCIRGRCIKSGDGGREFAP